MKKTKMAMLLSALLISGVASADLTTGLVAYYPFDDCNAKDNSDNGNDGTLNGNAQCVSGIKSKALSFNGSTDYVYVPHSESLNITEQISFGAWVNLKDVTGFADNDIILNKEGIPYELAIHDNTGSVTCFPDSIPTYNFSFYIDAGHESHQCGWADGGKAVQKNVWTFLFITYDGNQIKTYFDGKLVSTYYAGGYINTTYEPLLIGARGGSGIAGAFFNGLIDEVRIYNRALTAAEITALYHQGVKPTKNGISSNTDQCINNANWCIHPTFEFLGMTSNSDIPISLINTSYIVDGMTRAVNNGKVNITANLYNRGYADAMLDIYDKQGNWTNFIRLDGNRPETSVVGDIWDKWTTTYDSYNDEYSTFDPRDAGSSKKLNVIFPIPQGGYARLSKNSTTAIANTLINSTLDIIGAGDYFPKEGSVRKKIIKLFEEEIAKSSINLFIGQLTNAIDKNNDTDARYIFTELTKESLSIAFRVFVTEGDARTRLIQIMGGNEKRYTKLFGKKVAQFISKAGGLVSIAEGVATSLGLAGQWIDIAKANNDKAVYFK